MDYIIELGEALRSISRHGEICFKSGVNEKGESQWSGSISIGDVIICDYTGHDMASVVLGLSGKLGTISTKLTARVKSIAPPPIED